MKLSPLILLVALVGCGRSEPRNAALEMNKQIQQWIPKGTSIAAARQIMEQHQFVCTVGSYDSKAAMPAGSDALWWNIGSFISSDGKTRPVTNVTILSFKSAAPTNALAFDATLTAVNGETDGRYFVSAYGVK